MPRGMRDTLPGARWSKQAITQGVSRPTKPIRLVDAHWAELTCTLCACIAASLLTSTGYAQIDPEPRNLLQLGVNQSLHNDGPTAAYAFYYWNMPDVPTTNMTLRLAIAPVYADG